MTMKKRELSIATNLLSLVALFLLFSSFTYLANNHAAAAVTAETQQSFWTALQGFSLEKLSFWQKTALFVGASTGSYALVRREYHRHYDEGMGCLGVLGLLILIPIVIALFPLILVVGLFMLILGIPFPRFGGRGHRRHRHYRRERW